MATKVVPNDKFSKTSKSKQLEFFTLIWLDNNNDAIEDRYTEQRLLAIINHFVKFADFKSCQEYIESQSKDDRLMLIVSGQLGQVIVPFIHDLQQVSSIYVYCMDKKKNEQWACNFVKIKRVMTDMEELISHISADHKIQKKVEEPFSMETFNTGESTEKVNGKFVFSQVLIECLLHMKPNEKDEEELISFCMSQYKSNQDELSHIQKFQKEYSSTEAIKWYTRECFFYKTLNGALRKQDIHMIFLFRSIIADIYRQLQNHQTKSPLKVFRGQAISLDELNTLKKSVGQLISINSFFSTSLERSTALWFLTHSKSTHLQRVLFEIEADPRMISTKPFADINDLSDIPGEAEVLFMFGSIFRINSINRDDRQVWIVRMTLCSDDEYDLKNVLTHMKNQYANGQTNLRTLAKIVWNMGQYDLAEKYYYRFLDELPSNDPSRTHIYEELAQIASQKGEFDKSIKLREKVLELKPQTPQIPTIPPSQSPKSTRKYYFSSSHPRTQV